MADKTYLVRGYYPEIGLRYWYSSSATDLFFEYPSDVYYPTPTSNYQDVIICDIVQKGSGGSSTNSNQIIDNFHVAGFTGSIVAGEPLVLTLNGLEKAFADMHNSVYGVAASTMDVVAGTTILPAITCGICNTGSLAAISTNWSVGDTLYLTPYSSKNIALTKDIATLSATSGINIIKIGTWVGTNIISVLPSFITYTG